MWTIEWTNLANDPKFSDGIREHTEWLAAADFPPAPGSAHRILVQENGRWLREGKPIDPSDLDD